MPRKFTILNSNHAESLLESRTKLALLRLGESEAQEPGASHPPVYATHWTKRGPVLQARDCWWICGNSFRAADLEPLARERIVTYRAGGAVQLTARGRAIAAEYRSKFSRRFADY